MALLLFVLFSVPGAAEAQKSKSKAKAAPPEIVIHEPAPAPPPPVPTPNVLTEVAVGDGPDYTRLAFTFKNPLDSYVLRRDDVDRLVIDFGPVQRGSAALPPPHELVSSVELEVVEGRLTARVQVASTRFELRHFASRDKYSCLLDIKNLAAEAPAEAPPEEGAMLPLRLPSLPETARRLSAALGPEPGPKDGPAENLYRRFLGELADWNNPAALADAELFLQHFSGRPQAAPVSFLKAELDFLAGPPAETYARATEGWQGALERWPADPLAARAKFMLAEADRLAGHNNEAAARFKILTEEIKAEGDDLIYRQLALLRAADLLLGMGLIDEARGLLEPVVAAGQADRLGLEAYARMGQADFYQGAFSQASEIFREALKLSPYLYRTYPEMLYGLGEGYHYLERPDLSRRFLFQALNLMPDHPKADVMLARIGDDYRQEGRDREAMAVYGAARRNFPNGDGGLISQVRLADMGALHSFFSQDKVFDALERGSRQATVEMYKSIVETGSHSPLIQLAQLKIGAALAEDGENAEAVKWLRDLEVNSPRSTLLPEALPVLSRALANEIALRAELEDWRGIADLYADNSSYLQGDDLQPTLRTVARAFEQLARYADAREAWLNLEETLPARRLDRFRALVANSLKINRPLEALAFIQEMIPEFPGERNWINEHLTRIGQELARPRNEQAASDLVQLVESVSAEPVRRDALADAIEIEINGRRYQRALALMDLYRRDYPDDELTPEYILTQAKIAEYEKKPEEAWNYLSDFRINFPADSRGPELLRAQIAEAEKLGRTDDALRFMELYRGYFPGTPESRAMMLEKMQREWSLGRYADSMDTMDAFQRDFAGDPIIVDLLIRRSNQDWEKGRYQDARRALENLAANYTQDPKTISFLLDRANKDWEKDRSDEARRTLADLLRLYPQDPRVGDLMLKWAEGDWARGRASAAQKGWAEFRRTFPGDPRVADSYVTEYRRAMDGGQTGFASALASEIKRTRPDDARLQASLLLEEARDSLAAGRAAEAVDKWNLFRQKYPDDDRQPDLLLVQARQEMKMGRQADALAHYREIIDRYPRHHRTPEVYLELAAAETRLNQPLAAWDHLDYFNRSYEDHPARAKALLDQAELGRQLGRPDQAAELYRAFRRDYPNNLQVPATYLAQARLELAAGRPGAALQTLEGGVLASPELDGDPNVQSLLTDLYLEDGQVENWAALVERNLGRAENPKADLPDRFLKYSQLGQVYQKLGRVADAERNFESALANRPPDASPEAIYAIANAFKEMVLPEKRIAALKILSASSDPFWRKAAGDELAAMGAPLQPGS